MRRGLIVRMATNARTLDGARIDPMQMAARDALIGFMAANESTSGSDERGSFHRRRAIDVERGGSSDINALVTGPVGMRYFIC